MKILYSITQNVEYPYNRLDDAPVAGLSEDLVILEKIEAQRPEYDPLTQELRSTWTADLAASKYIQSYELRDLPPERLLSNWNGLYIDLMSSNAYTFFVSLEFQYPQVSVALTKVIAAIQYGITQGNLSSNLEIISKAALQSAINLLFQQIAQLELTVEPEIILEVRNLLDKNLFETISL